MQYESFGSKVGRITKRIFRIIIFLFLITVIAVISFLYWGTYEEGVMAGKVLRISQKGMIFKTYEGKISLETFGALRDVSPIAETFDFSIEKGDDNLIKQLQQVSLSGERVNLYYVKRYAKFPWRGDTKYFAIKVERVAK